MIEMRRLKNVVSVIQTILTFVLSKKTMSENIIKLNLKQNANLYCIIIWLTTYVQRKHIFDNFMISLQDNTESLFSNSSQQRVIIESV